MVAVTVDTVVAHAVGGVNYNLPLLVLAGALLITALAVGGGEGTRRRIGVALLVGAVVVGVVSFLPPVAGDAAPDATITILEPADGATLPADEPVAVRVAVENGRVAASPDDAEGGHLHLYLDGQLQQMPYTMDAVVILTPGEHTLTVEYVDARHVSFDPEVEHTIRVTAERRG